MRCARTQPKDNSRDRKRDPRGRTHEHPPVYDVRLVRPDHGVRAGGKLDASILPLDEMRLGRTAIDRDCPIGVHQIGQNQSAADRRKCLDDDSIWLIIGDPRPLPISRCGPRDPPSGAIQFIEEERFLKSGQRWVQKGVDALPDWRHVPERNIKWIKGQHVRDACSPQPVNLSSQSFMVPQNNVARIVARRHLQRRIEIGRRRKGEVGRRDSGPQHRREVRAGRE